MHFDFSHKVALITGASRSIGRAIAELMAADGATIIVHYHTNRAAAEATRAALPGSGHTLAQANMADTPALERLVQQALADHGRIDILVNNAGIYEDHPPAAVDFDTWQQAWRHIIDVNLIGAAHLSFLCAQVMQRQGGGRIVNVSSRASFRGEPTAPAYGASKAGLNQMGQSMAKALAPHNIFVHTVAPGFVDTEMAAETLAGPLGDEIRAQSPLGRVATAEEVARTVCFCAAPGSEFLTGCIIDVNGASYLRS